MKQKLFLTSILLFACLLFAGCEQQKNLKGIYNPTDLSTYEGDVNIDGNATTTGSYYVGGDFTLAGTVGTGGIDMNGETITNIGDTGTDFDGDGGLTLAENGRLYGSTDQLWTQATGHLSDLIRLKWNNNTAKPAITWYDENGVAQAAIVAHDYLSAGNRHQHISIETKNNTDDQLHTRFECLFDKDDDADGGYCGAASSYDLRVGSGGDLYIVDGDIQHGSTFDLCPNDQTTKCIRFATSTDSNPMLIALGSDTLRIDDNIEMRKAQPLIYLNSAYALDYASTIRLTGESGSDDYRGGYLQFDASGNDFILGVHNTSDELTSSDIEMLHFDRDGTDVYFTNTGNLGIGTNSPTEELEVDGIIKTTPTASRTCDADAEGGIMYDSDDNHFYGCNGSAWVQLDN